MKLCSGVMNVAATFKTSNHPSPDGRGSLFLLSLSRAKLKQTAGTASNKKRINR